MFGIVLLAAVILGGGYIAITEINKPTGQKLQPGDNAFVPLDQLSCDLPTDALALKTFLAGFVSVVAKVTNVVKDTAIDTAHGDLVGFPAKVSFPLNAVASIDRNGTKIV